MIATGRLIVVLALMLAACGGATPHATFDGEDCSYAGPESVTTGDVQFGFTNTSSDDAALALLVLVDHAAREQEAALVGTRAEVEGTEPEGATELAGFIQAVAGDEVTQTTPMPVGTYFLDCVTFEGGAPHEVWRVALLDVEE